MKKIILTAMAVFAFGFANAQKVEFGAKVGFNLANVTGDAVGNSTRFGFNGGFFADINLSEKLVFQPELLYSTQGAKYKGEDGYNANIDYLNVPLMLKYYVTEKFNIEAGPQVGFLLSAKSKDSEGSYSIKDETKSTDFGLNFGLGYDFTKNIFVNGRYNLGLSNIIKNTEGEDYNAKNSVFSFAVGYKF
jgi:hypothetical protein